MRNKKDQSFIKRLMDQRRKLEKQTDQVRSEAAAGGGRDTEAGQRADGQGCGERKAWSQKIMIIRGN